MGKLQIKDRSTFSIERTSSLQNNNDLDLIINSMKCDSIPLYERYVLTVTEAAEYYHIGEAKLRKIAEDHPEADFIILNGNRLLFKRQKFEKFLDNATTV